MSQPDAAFHQRVKEALLEALERTDHHVDEWLGALARDEPDVAERVRALLVAHREANGFIEANDGPPASAFETARAAGARIGSFIIERELGQGGMGAVLLGSRHEAGFTQHVAIKVIRGLTLDRRALERFMEERRILASLNHPYIAHFVDGGNTDGGQPYLAMEYVAGEPITRYCDQRALAAPERVRLFLKVCDAVQFAHQRLVVHRDIKPSNILVTSDGTPKLLDFGIAKLIDSQVSSNVVTQRVLTPQYASPEQAAGRAVTTATDVYSLGVLLYELLTGNGPYRSVSSESAPLAVLEAIRNEAPERPSLSARRAGRHVDADLDAILLKTLRKDEADRYSSIEQLRDDLARYLDGEPVRAQTGSRAYVIRKFVARHRAPIAASLVAAASLLGATIVSTRQARVAEQERARAQARFNDVRKLANAVVGPVYDSIAKVPGSTGARQLVVKEALAYLDGLVAQSGDDVDLKAELADAYRKIGDVQGNMYSQNLGDHAGARASYTRLIELRRAVVAARPQDPSVRAAMADAESRLADLDFGAGQLESSIQLYHKALAEFDAVPGGVSGETAIVTHATIRRNLAYALSRAGKSANADKEFVQAIALIEPLATRPGASNAVRRALLGARANFGEHLATNDKPAEALPHFEAALGIVRSMSANPADPAQLRYDLYAATNRMTMALQMMGRAEEAFAYFSESMGVLEELARLDPQSTRLQFDLATTYFGLSILERERGNVSAAAGAIAKSLDLYKATFAKDPTAREFLFNFAGAHGELGEVEDARRRWPEAAAAFREAIAITADPNVNSRRPSERINFYRRLGDVLAAHARQTGASRLVSEARTAYLAARDGYASLVATGQMVPEYKDHPAQVEEKLKSLGGEAR